ncbi:CiaD-like domain-containing protein [Hydrogenimonas sp.]
MELKDVILSTLAEIGEEPLDNKKEASPMSGKRLKEVGEELQRSVAEAEGRAARVDASPADFVAEEREFLEHLRERVLVLFEGFQSPNNKRLEAKIDLTLNFLEYLLATLDERIEALKKS